MALKEVVLERTIPVERAIEALRRAPMEACEECSDIFPFRNASIRLADVHPNEVNPSSLYVVRSRLDTQRELRRILLDRYGIDTLKLAQVLHLVVDGVPGEIFPPYVESSPETAILLGQPGDRTPPPPGVLRIPLLLDGMHRMWLAREEDTTTSSILAHGVFRPDGNLEYAYPNSWDDVRVFEEVPPQDKKKYFRRRDPYSLMTPLRALRMRGEGRIEYGRS